MARVAGRRVGGPWFVFAPLADGWAEVPVVRDRQPRALDRTSVTLAFAGGGVALLLLLGALFNRTHQRWLIYVMLLLCAGVLWLIWLRPLFVGLGNNTAIAARTLGRGRAGTGADPDLSVAAFSAGNPDATTIARAAVRSISLTEVGNQPRITVELSDDSTIAYTSKDQRLYRAMLAVVYPTASSG